MLHTGHFESQAWLPKLRLARVGGPDHQSRQGHGTRIAAIHECRRCLGHPSFCCGWESICERSRRAGKSKPAADKEWAARRSESNASGNESRPARDAVRRSAKAGSRRAKSWRQSAQEAQYAADARRTALQRPKPPCRSANWCGFMGLFIAFMVA